MHIHSCVHMYVHVPTFFPPLFFMHSVFTFCDFLWKNIFCFSACVFTIGHFLSNRSLFPSQDFPTALPTWHAAVTVDGELTVLLTGDKEPQVTTTEDGR